VIRFEHLSEAQKRAYLLADNQIALQGGWDEPALAESLGWLRGGDFDLDLIGFDATELERLLALADGEAGSDEAEDEVIRLTVMLYIRYSLSLRQVEYRRCPSKSA
jgi:hypothetical protein